MIDNSPDANAKQSLDKYPTTPGIKILYEHENEHGIPFARNKSMEMASQVNADWILFIDDDEIASTNWIQSYLDVAELYPADIYRGPVEIIYPDNTPNWLPKRSKRVPETGTAIRMFSTSNLMIKGGLVNGKSQSLRFDTSMRYTGGSDKEAFRRALKNGAKAISAREAIVQEVFPPIRATLKWQLSRSARVSMNSVQVKRRHDGALFALPYFLFKSITSIASGLAKGIIASFQLLVSRKKGQQKLFLSAEKIFSGFGYFIGVLGISLHPYKNTDGY